MNYVARGGFALSALLIGLNLASCSLMNPNAQIDQAPTVKHAQTATKLEATKASAKKVQEKKVAVNWNKPSGGPYPKLTSGEPIWIDVSIKDQRVYIKNGDKTIYTMIASTGLDTDPQTTTPTGTYYIQGERGKWFYSPRYKEGAEYWVSWKNHGEFLFHSVPMNEDKKVLAADAARLGEKDSHGCVHLTVPDAKWIYENIAYNTKVVIH